MTLRIFLLLSVSEVSASHSTEYEFRLTNPQTREIELVLNFSTFEDCQGARAVAEYFNYWATCTLEEWQ